MMAHTSFIAPLSCVTLCFFFAAMPIIIPISLSIEPFPVENKTYCYCFRGKSASYL